MDSSPLRILTNKPWVAEYRIANRPVIAEPVRSDRKGLSTRFKRFALWRYDAIFLDGESRWLLSLCAVKKVLRRHGCLILASDIILNRPRGLGRLKFRFRRWLLREVDAFVLYYRDTTELQQAFSIPENKIHYVPFKPNTLSDLLGMEVSEGDYFLSPGRSNRDLGTLFEAFHGLPYTCKVLAPWTDLELHGTRVDSASRPSNVSLLSDDGTTKSWNDWIARALAVVIPIEPGKLSPSGIGTYLVAMALGKCVIITEGPATRQILNAETAVMVPPRDHASLRAAIAHVAEDADFRRRIAARGKEYALSLGGEARLRADLVEQLSNLLLASK